MNKRNLGYVNKYNSKEGVEIANDKRLTKKVLEEAEIPSVKTIAIIKNEKELNNFDFNSLPKSFVMKPASGLDGLGIDIFYNRDKTGNWVRNDGSKASTNDLKKQAYNIIDGYYSHGHRKDTVIIEQRIQPWKSFRQYTYKGVPDIRILVFKGVPIMAFVRWPTKESKGKANMFLGAVATGVDLANGVTTHSVSGKSMGGKGEEIEYVPDSNLRYSGIRIPYWEEILLNAVKAAKASHLGYAAIDFLIDRENGPIVVEVNARPGLSIQLVNKDGLEWRLDKLKGLKIKSFKHGVRVGKNLFGGEVEEEVEALTGKKLIGFIENVKTYSTNGKSPVVVKAKIDTGAGSTSLDIKLAKKLGYTEALNTFEKYKSRLPEKYNKDKDSETVKNLVEEMKKECPDIRFITHVKSASGKSYRIRVLLKLEIAGEEKEVFATITDREDLIYPIIIGRRSLDEFLIDPALTFAGKKLTKLKS